MNPVYETNENETLTFGDVCEALADRELPATIEEGYFVVRKGDLKRFVQATTDISPVLLALFMREPVQVAG